MMVLVAILDGDVHGLFRLTCLLTYMLGVLPQPVLLPLRHNAFDEDIVGILGDVSPMINPFYPVDLLGHIGSQS